MYELIQKWLTSKKDYAIGLEIFKKYSTNNFLIRVLSDGEGHWNKQTLEKELTKLRDSIPTIEKEEEFIKAKELIKEERKRPSDSENAPQEVKDVIENRKKIYNEGKKLHARLAYFKSEEERYLACVRILAIRAELKKMWSFTNFYDDNLRLPEDIQAEAIKWEGLDDLSLNQEWHKHYKYIRKWMTDKTKIDTLKKRLTIAFSIKEILIERNAFQYQNLNLPTINDN